MYFELNRIMQVMLSAEIYALIPKQLLLFVFLLLVRKN